MPKVEIRVVRGGATYAPQKIVVKVPMKNDKKTFFQKKVDVTCKAMQVVVGVRGVDSVAFDGPNKQQITVTGEGIDVVKLTNLLRKNVGYTDLVSVQQIEEKKETKSKPDTSNIEYLNPQNYYPMQVVHEVPFSSCNIL